ncbi:MAG: hypothetical protein L0154_15625 [Chloroflexi bacterium]|nr:hypothetical protein [Chloroflexota bacterium]
MEMYEPQHGDYMQDEVGSPTLTEVVRGYIRAAVRHIASGKQITVEENACRIGGKTECRFVARWPD